MKLSYLFTLHNDVDNDGSAHEGCDGSEVDESVLLIERYGRKIGIDSDVTESGMTMLKIELVFQRIHKPSANVFAAIVQRHSETANPCR